MIEHQEILYKSVLKDRLKEHEIAELVNRVIKAVKALCPNAPQCTRQIISRAMLRDADIIMPQNISPKANLIHLEVYGDKENTGYNVHYAPNLKMIGYIYKEVDGFFVYQPSKGDGCWSGELLKEIAQCLEDLNKAWKNKINNKLSK
jgi:hypothetical protein